LSFIETVSLLNRSGADFSQQLRGPSLLIYLVPHDMRRSAIRNFRKAGLSETEGMKLSGHRTRNVYDRYNIVDDEDSRQAMRQAQEYLKHEAGRKVIPLKRKA
jgi:integrase